MTNYALPVNDKDISKAKTFYDTSAGAVSSSFFFPSASPT